MKARLVRTGENELIILCSDGSISKADDLALNAFMFRFQKIDELSGNLGAWRKEYPDMNSYPGTTVAYVTDAYTLLIIDITPFKPLFDVRVNTAIQNLLTVPEYAALHGKSVEQIKVFCRNNRIPGATKKGRDWLIPADAPYPLDERISVGSYMRRR